MHAAQSRQDNFRVISGIRAPVVAALPSQTPLPAEVLEWLFALRLWLLAFPAPPRLEGPTTPLGGISAVPLSTVAVPKATPALPPIHLPSLVVQPRPPVPVLSATPSPLPVPTNRIVGSLPSTDSFGGARIPGLDIQPMRNYWGLLTAQCCSAKSTARPFTRSPRSIVSVPIH